MTTINLNGFTRDALILKGWVEKTGQTFEDAPIKKLVTLLACDYKVTETDVMAFITEGL